MNDIKLFIPVLFGTGVLFATLACAKESDNVDVSSVINSFQSDLMGLSEKPVTPRVSTPKRHTVTQASAADGMARWLDFHKRYSSINDLSYMFDYYHQSVTNLKTGKSTNIYDYVQSHYQYVNRWVNRHYDIIDHKITGNFIEIRSRYTCTNTKGKTVQGYCKSTYRIKNDRIDGFADDSSSKQLPAFWTNLSDVTSSAPVAGSLTLNEVRRHVLRHADTVSRNNLFFMYEDYEKTITNLNTGKSQALTKRVQEHQTYVNRWCDRRFEIIDFAFRGQRIEIRSRFVCVSNTGKKSIGYCKTIYNISPNGRIDGVADVSSKTSLPSFSDNMSGPYRL